MRIPRDGKNVGTPTAPTRNIRVFELKEGRVRIQAQIKELLRLESL